MRKKNQGKSRKVRPVAPAKHSGSALMPDVWNVLPLEVQPALDLSHWRVSEVAVGGKRERHVWGWNCIDLEGRASSAITKLQPESRTVVTASGRLYRLLGSPGWNSDGAHTWGRWMAINQAADEIDVTAEVESQLSAKT